MNTMNLIEQVAHCIEFGKINKASPYPPELKGQDGADEYTQMALESGFAADEILQKGGAPCLNAPISTRSSSSAPAPS